MSKNQFLLGNTPLLLGKQIGRGGEGEVYLAPNDPKTAIKIYTVNDLSQREVKVSSMVKYKLAELTSLVSFPKAIVKTKNGDFAGFAMNLVAEHRPLHQVYGPKSRKLHFPKADFRFLLRVATNVARAVGQVHRAACIIGDINHSGILVSNGATVAIIDADSFQFEANGKFFPCLVGVPDFTPPELQGRNLKGIVRTKHHDNFGLAVAIFQLLFMGRHPYAGRHADQNVSLEQAIERNLFAYSRVRKLEAAPPAYVATLDEFPTEVANAFERAFGLDHLSRPNPDEWIDILKHLESELSRCNRNPIHYFPTNGKGCPWCKMEDSSGAILFEKKIEIPNVIYTINSNFNINDIWAAIEKIKIPQIHQLQPKLVIPHGLAPSPNVSHILSSIKRKKIFLGLGIIAAVAAFVIAPALFIVWLTIIVSCAACISNTALDTNEWIEKYKKTDITFSNALGAWQQRLGSNKLYEIRTSLEAIITEYRSLGILRSKALSKLTVDRRNNQLIRYLDRYLINVEPIQGIGPSKKVILNAYGIESAADINYSSIMNIPGFGEATTAKLTEWREKLERKFVYNSKTQPSDILVQDLIEKEFHQKSDDLLKSLSSGCTELQYGVAQLQARAAIPDNYLNQIAIARAQIEVEMHFLNIPLPGSPKTQSASPIITTVNPINTIHCPRCGSSMIKRIARRGSNKGNSFWGCSTYPRCRGTKP